MDETLHAAITAVIPNCYGTIAPATAQTPYVIWQRIGGEDSEYLDNNEEPQVQRAIVQIEVLSADVLEPKTQMQALTAALRSSDDLLIRPASGLRDDYHHDMELFSASRDFEVVW